MGIASLLSLVVSFFLLLIPILFLFNRRISFDEALELCSQVTKKEERQASKAKNPPSQPVTTTTTTSKPSKSKSTAPPARTRTRHLARRAQKEECTVS